MDKIAVIIDGHGLSSTFFDGSHINIYKKTVDDWKCIDSIEIGFNTQKGIQALRQSLKETICTHGYL